MKKYVVLEHLLLPDRGLRFFTLNKEDNTHGYNGELWYKEVYFTDDVEDAQLECRHANWDTFATFDELVEYCRSTKKTEDIPQDIFSDLKDLSFFKDQDTLDETNKQIIENMKKS